LIHGPPNAHHGGGATKRAVAREPARRVVLGKIDG
jgi:hypothetical protein